MPKYLKVSLFCTIALGLIVMVAGIYAWQYVNALSDVRLSSTKPIVVHVKAGESAPSIYRDLVDVSKKLDDYRFRAWLKLNPNMSQVKVGYYEFPVNTTVGDLFTRLSSGKETQFSIALVEGQTIAQWLKLIRSQANLKQDIPDASSLYKILVEDSSLDASGSAGFCRNELRTVEGCLLADTYFYNYQDSALSVIQRAYQAMEKTLEAAWQSRYADIPLNSPYEALILASIIEKETAVASERGLIAGVFSNRLELNMRLQTDPTVIYGIGPEFDGNITRKHLRTTTPYNTYRIKGLPPTPIAMAGRESLNAAVMPQITDYLYFVAKGDGSHQFSTTLAQHNDAVAKYQLNRN